VDDLARRRVDDRPHWPAPVRNDPPITQTPPLVPPNVPAPVLPPAGRHPDQLDRRRHRGRGKPVGPSRSRTPST
jgi:hypothetical protein